jgi:glutamyl-tRNA reductase
MELSIIGISHKSAPIGIREQLAFSQQEIATFMQTLLKQGAVQEIVMIFTCNRTELYCYTDQIAVVWDAVKEKLAHLQLDLLENCCYRYVGITAIRHILYVASGMDSMVLGEAEILGQVKSAFQLARLVGGVGGYFNRLFPRIFAAVKQVRRETALGSNSLSVAYIAVVLAKTIFSNLTEAEVFVIGAGDVAGAILKHLMRNGVGKIWLVNRDEYNAYKLHIEFKSQPGWRFLALEKLSEALHQADIVISSTASSLPIVQRHMVEEALCLRKQRPMLFIDIAVPRDIDSSIGDLDNVHLYCVDNLQTIANDNKQVRCEELTKAKNILELYVQEMLQWQARSGLSMHIQNLQQVTEVLAETCLTEALEALADGQAATAVLTDTVRKMTNKFLHLPILHLQQSASHSAHHSSMLLEPANNDQR